MTQTADAYSEFTEEVFGPYCEGFDRKLEKLLQEGATQQLMDLADELDRVMMKHFRLVRYGIPVHNLGMNLITNYMLKRWLGERAQTRLFPVLVGGLEHKTSETNRRIYELAELVREHAGLLETINSTPSNDLYGILSSRDTESAQLFLSRFDEFLHDFGVRGFTREIYYPRWEEEPGYVFDILKSLVSGECRNVSDQESILRRKRAKAEAIVEEALKNQRFGPIKLTLFNTILGVSRTYISFRENQRFNLDRWITRNRKLFLALGKQLRDQGYLENTNDIFFLYRKEIRRILKGKSNLTPSQVASKASERHADFKKYEDVTPPKFLHGDREFNDPLPDSKDALRGIPASHGVVTGTVRILTKIEDIPQVKSGDILVVPRTDPGWTPVFSKIGGLVTETGGILSHGAVVSREFGIPAVTNIRNACQTLSSGQVVTLDGNQGVVIPESGE
jgi:pyruvate,water dikinase